MKTANLGAVRRLLLVSAVLTLSASAAGAQIVERSRTLADLLQSHPCNSGLAGRHTIVTDCDAADDLGNGGGAFSCFARCDGVDTWAAVSIGAGGGSSGPATELESPVTIEGTADAFEGNFTFADPTADWTLAFDAIGRATFPLRVRAENYIVFGNNAISELEDLRITSSKAISFSNGADYSRSITGAGVTGPVVKVNSAINLAPLASPPRTCDATAEGDIYSDTSHALCFCDGTSWNVLTGSGAGSCV